MIRYFYFSFLIFLFIGFTIISAQTVSVAPYGVSPREADADENDAFPREYNALLNVGTETLMYLKAEVTDANIADGFWTLVEKPEGSTADFAIGETNLEENWTITHFTPDIVGKYVVRFTVNGVTDEVTINAGKYMGIADAGCANCHSGIASKWDETGHSTMLQRGLDGLLAPYYSENCIECHTVGYDTQADNDGFDDREFVFPDELFVGQYDNMVAAYPDAMKLANIQCESCHGPGSQHFGNKADNRITISLDSEMCARCHDSGDHHFRPAQLKYSGHSAPPSYPTGPGRASCARCHTTEGFIEYVSGEEVTEHDYSAFSCAMCHDPHDTYGDDGRHQLRTVSATLGNGFEVTEGGNGKLCMNCHQSRRDADTYTEEPQSHYGPHYMTQADMFNATNAVTFGYNLPSSPHIKAVPNSCAGCHMAESHPDEGIPYVGDHTFSMVDVISGEEHVEVCNECHGDVGESFDDKKYFDENFVADHDGDGVEEGIHDEVEGLMEELANLLPAAEGHDAYDPHDDVDETWSKVELKAAFNYQMVYYDRSHGIHNPAFTVALLKVSIEALKYGVITAGEMQHITDIPNDQGFQVRVVWTKFGADDNIAPDQVASYAVLRKVEGSEGPQNEDVYNGIASIPIGKTTVGNRFRLNNELWDVVADIPALQFGEYAAVVPTLQNNVVGGDTAWTTFKVLGKTESGIVAETGEMSGYSVDNLAPLPPTGFAAMLTDGKVDLTWEEAVDKDFQYFAVYRSETQGFEPSVSNILATTINTEYDDETIESGKTYFYKVAAFDYAGNRGETSAEIPIIVTSLISGSGIPTEYSLNQNYPNPFNPTTEISFGIPKSSNVKITIYNSVGKEVAVLVNRNLSAGYHTYKFDASRLASGVYFYNMQSDNFVNVKKMLLVK